MSKKLKKYEIDQIKLIRKNTNMSLRKIAKVYNVSYQTIKNYLDDRKKLEGRDKKRELIREFYNHICQSCGKKWELGKRRFDVHHNGMGSSMTKKYDKHINYNTVTLLCHKCHLNLPEHTETMSKGHKNNK